MSCRGPSLIAWILSLQSVALAQPILHEYVPPPGKEDLSSWARRGELPSHIRVEDRTLAQPSDRAPQRQERILGRGGDRQTVLSPDRSTGADGILRYRAAFNPSVVPFKRMSAMDQVGPGYIMGVRDPHLKPIPLTRVPPSPDRDQFWGSVALQVKPGQPVPIPSVAPESRIISYRTRPHAQVSFLKDSADNFWIQTNARGTLRLIFLTDAPRYYFSPLIPLSVTTEDVPAMHRPVLPDEISQAARRVLERIGLGHGTQTTIGRQLQRLTAYFRNFRPGALPRLTGDTYLDIALSQKGVCRHRSFAFVVTAQALGIPARYIQNEAHAFAEAWIPRLGWVRVDLGGASPELSLLNASDKAVHNPPPDPFPRPSNYARSYSRLAGDSARGIRPGQRIRSRKRGVPLQRYDRSRHRIPAPTASSAEPGAGVEGRSTSRAPARGAEALKRPVQISLVSSERSVYRGERVTIWGKVTHAGSGIVGLPVEIYLSRDGQMADARLGVTVSETDGRFHASLPVPRQLRVGEYRIFAATPGNDLYEASISR